ncbi:hypothetical protein Q7C36_016898 [Tachysurus vachellii]|uniref:Uncharacterized protein n=1 Tax=Tachysurus vachellii TaxID=175792 RepID=A0AA88MAH3_TACVA|nr:hypothetical protein Q7C36_016898 [Tachysurus vachellii]
MLQRGRERKRKCSSQQRLDDEAGEDETKRKSAADMPVRDSAVVTRHLIMPRGAEQRPDSLSFINVALCSASHQRCNAGAKTRLLHLHVDKEHHIHRASRTTRHDAEIVSCAHERRKQEMER